MNEEALPETMSLGEFLEKADVSEWSAAEIWARAELLYPHLAPALAEIKTQFIASSPDEAKAILLRAFERAERELPPQIKSVKSAPERLASVPSRAKYIAEVADSHGLEKKKIRRRFIHQLVDAFAQEPSAPAAEEKIANSLTQRTITGEVIKTAIIKTAENIPVGDVDDAIKKHQGELERVKYVEAVIDRVAVEAFDDPVPKPEVFFSIAQEAAMHAKKIVPVDEIIRRSAELSRATAAVNADISDLGDLSGSGTFFQSFAKNGLEKAVAPAADALLDIIARVNPPAAKAFVERVIDASLARVVKNTEQTTQVIIDRMGATAAQSSFIQSTIQQWGQQVDQRSGASGMVKARSVFDDLAGAIFGKNIDEGVLDYAELIHLQFIKSDQLPTWQQIHVIGIVQHQPHLVHFEPISGAGGWALSWLSSAIAQKTGGKVASTVAGEVGKKAFSAIATRLGLTAVLGTVSAGTSLAFQAAANAGFWLGGKIRDFAGFLFSGQWISGLMSDRGKTKWQDNQPLIIAAGSVIFLVTILLYFVGMNDLVDKEALVPGLGGKIGTSTGPGIDCTKTPDAPECKLSQCQGDCRWPLDVSTKFCISEGPFVGTHSLSHLSAVDFLTIGNQRSLFGASVYSQYAGTVESAVFGYLDDSGFPGNNDGGTYGNHVVIRTDNGGRLLFAHLRNIQTVQSGESIQAGKVIGYVDHTGYSYDVHLHYEDQSGDINKFLPFPVPPCESVNDCDQKLQLSGHAACQ